MTKRKGGRKNTTRFFTVVGTSAHRVDGIEKATGAAKYTYDITAENMLFGRLLGCPHGHCRITEAVPRLGQLYSATGASFHHLQRGLNDVRVGAATAEIPGHRVIDIVV